MGKGYPEHVEKSGTQSEYEAKTLTWIDKALEYVYTENPTDSEVDALFPGLSMDNLELNGTFMDAVFTYMTDCGAYSWVRGTTTPEFRKMLYEAKRLIFPSLVQNWKYIKTQNILCRRYPDGKFENYICYELEMSDGTTKMTSMPWYDVKKFYQKKYIFNLMRHKKDFEEYNTPVEFTGSDTEYIRKCGALMLMGFIVSALLPAKKIVKKPKVKKPQANKKPQFKPRGQYQQKLRPYGEKRPYQERRSYDNGGERKPYYQKPYQQRPYEKRYNNCQNSDDAQQQRPSGQNGNVVMRHRRPRIQRPPIDSSIDIIVEPPTIKL
jgi:hypothetical protein